MNYQEQRGRLVAQAREAMDEIRSNTDEARAAELEERHDKIMSEFDAVEAKIAREERQAEIEAKAEAAEKRAREARRPVESGEAAGADNGEGMSYRQAFIELFKAGGDKSDMSNEARAALKAGYTQLGKEERAQTTSTTEGGTRIPSEDPA